LPIRKSYAAWHSRRTIRGTRSAEQQSDRYFAELRRDAPISRHHPLEEIMRRPEQERMSHWAIVLHEDVRRISRDPDTFSSPRSAGSPLVWQNLRPCVRFFSCDARPVREGG
jgi:cytochrome P450